MKGPLQTVIRNLTDKPLNYPACKLFVKPKSEFLLSFDPFTKYESCAALERLLIDVKQGNALIIYLYDANYAAAAATNSVQLSRNAERILNQPVIEEVKVVKKTPARMEGTLPPGELPEAPKMEREKLDKNSRTEQKVSQAAADAAGIGAEPEEAKPSKTVEDMLEEKSLHREADPTKDPQKEEVIEAEVVEQPKKGARKKKEVVTL